MIKEIAKLVAVFGIMGGIVAVPNLINNGEKVYEPDLDLPTVGSYEKLKELVETADEYGYKWVEDDMLVFNASNSLKDYALSESTVMGEESRSETTDYSTTNVQVAGVDEADIIKNDDKYIYHLTNGKIVVSEIYPADSMKVVSTIKFDDNFYPKELYIDEDKIIAIGSRYIENGRYYVEDYTRIVVYDAKDKANIVAVKTVDVSGNYNSSRRIGNALYLIAQKGIYSYILRDENYGNVPQYMDSNVSTEMKSVPYQEIKYFPDVKCSNYMITVGVDLADLNKEAQVSTYLGNSSSIYASKDNMYVTFERYKKPNEEEKEVAIKRALDYSNRELNTTIYRFKLEDGKMNCKATGDVRGSILNQFSMDENDGYFRIATTVGSIYDTGENKSRNNMYVLNMNLETVGAIEDIAPGEKIYSVRFMGNRAYMVTFRKVDPLFVIDLSKPENPTILGKLKIPGYSDYLHPYDETHIIGFGKDAELVSNEEGSWGWADEDGVAAYYQGMKIALFDVTDPENPVEMWKENIGDRGTDSELLRNHKALLFSKDRNLLAFPVRVATLENKNAKAWEYGDTTFVGAYVYELTLENGFKLKAKLTNLTDEDWKKIGYYYYGDKEIDRLIYINDILYTIADSGYSAYKIGNYEEINSLKIK